MERASSTGRVALRFLERQWINRARAFLWKGDVEREKLRDAGNLKPGDLVQSLYRGTFYGEVLIVGHNTDRDGVQPFAILREICTADGRPFRDPKIRRLSPYWLRVVPSIPLKEDAEPA